MTRGQGCMSFFWLTSVTRNALSLSAWWMHGDSHTTQPLDGCQNRLKSIHQWHLSRNNWKHGACGKPNWNKNFKLHPILRHFSISLKPCYHVDIGKPKVIRKKSGRCNQIHKSRIHFFPSPNLAEAGGLSRSLCRHTCFGLPSSSGEIC